MSREWNAECDGRNAKHGMQIEERLAYPEGVSGHSPGSTAPRAHPGLAESRFPQYPEGVAERGLQGTHVPELLQPFQG